MRKILGRFLNKEQVLFEGSGLYSVVKVTKNGSRTNLYTGKAYLQSSVDFRPVLYGTLFDWYLAAPWYSGSFDGKLNSLLILGLGAGSQVKSYNRIYNIKNITGVEIDPLIVDLGKKYFDLNYDNLETINVDATSFLDSNTNVYDQVILDPFKEDTFEKKCQSPAFLRKISNHLSNNGVLLVNKVFGDPSNGELGVELRKVFSTVLTLRIYNNIFFISTNSASAPKSSSETSQLLLNASKLYPELRFFRSVNIRDMRVLG